MEYSPIELPNNKCYEYQNTDILRIYDSIVLNQEVTYTDYNTANHYSKISGKVTLDTTPICLDHNIFSDSFYYRNDLAHILIIFVIFCFVIIYCPLRLFLRFYKKGRL